MKYKVKEGELIVETTIFQGRNGAIFLDWGNTTIKLDREQSSAIAYDIPNFNVDDYNRYYPTHNEKNI